MGEEAFCRVEGAPSVGPLLALSCAPLSVQHASASLVCVFPALGSPRLLLPHKLAHGPPRTECECHVVRPPLTLHLTTCSRFPLPAPLPLWLALHINKLSAPPPSTFPALTDSGGWFRLCPAPPLGRRHHSTITPSLVTAVWVRLAPPRDFALWVSVAPSLRPLLRSLFAFPPRHILRISSFSPLPSPSVSSFFFSSHFPFVLVTRLPTSP